VRELRAARGVANGVDAAVGGLQPAVEHDARAVVADAGRFEAKAVDIRAAARGHEQVAPRYGLLAAVGAHDRADPAIGAEDARDRGA